MDSKNEEIARALQKRIDAVSASLDKDNNTEIQEDLSITGEEKLKKYEHTALHSQLQSYDRSVTMQMAFKDNLIEKLQKWLEESNDHRNRIGQKNVELVHNVLNLFKQRIEEIRHNQYQLKTEIKQPENSDALQIRINENNNNWKILKYYSNVTQMKTKKENTKIQNKNIEGIIKNENKTLQMILENINWKDQIYSKNMIHNYTTVLDKYQMKANPLIKMFIELKNKNENLLVQKKEMSYRTKQLLTKYNRLKIEPKSSKELKLLVEELDALKKNLITHIKQVTNNFKLSEKKKLYLVQITENIKEEINNTLKKGDALVKSIRQCQDIELFIGKDDLYPKRNECNNIEQTQQDSVLEELWTFEDRISYIKINSDRVKKVNNKLQRENDKLNEEIRLLRIRCKQ